MSGEMFDEVICIDDILAIGLPIGEDGVIAGFNYDDTKAQKYLIRFPAMGISYWVTPRDIMGYKQYLSITAIREMLYSSVGGRRRAGMEDEADAIEDMYEKTLEVSEMYVEEDIEEEDDDEYYVVEIDGEEDDD